MTLIPYNGQYIAQVAGAQVVLPGTINLSLVPILNPDFWYVLDPVDVTTDQSANHYDTTQTSPPTYVAGPVLGMVANRAGRWVLGTTPSAFRTAQTVSVCALISMTAHTGDAWAAAVEVTGQPFPTWWKFGTNAGSGPTAGQYRAVAAWDSGSASFYTPCSAYGTVPASGFVCVGWVRNGASALTAYAQGLPIGTAVGGPAATGSPLSQFNVAQDAFGVSANRTSMVIAGWLGRALTDGEMSTLNRYLTGQ